MRDFIPYSKQSITEDDIKYVSDALKSDFLTQGPLQKVFETQIESYLGVSHAHVVSSATAALHLCCLALGVGEGDIVWTSPITFVASANCALYCGADVEFIDIDDVSYNMSVSVLTEKLSYAEKHGCLPKVVIPVHLCGQSCDMEAIWELSKIYGFSVIEDASHALGGSYKGRKVGSCIYSHMSVFSLHAVKMITSGEGGVITSNDGDLVEKTKKLGSHGITKSKGDFLQDAADLNAGWYYEQQFLGFNYRLTDFQCALGMSQLKRLDDFVVKRNYLADVYDEMLGGLRLRLPLQRSDCVSSRHLYVIRLNLNDLDISRNEVYSYMASQKIGVNLHYMPVYRQPFYKQNNQGFRFECPQAEGYFSDALTIPLHQEMRHEEQDCVIRALFEILAPN